MQKIQDLLAEVESFKASSKEEVESFRLKYLSKKGILGEIFSDHGKRFYYYVKFGSGLEIGTISEEEISTQHQAFAQSVVDQLGQDAQRRPIQSANRRLFLTNRQLR